MIAFLKLIVILTLIKQHKLNSTNNELIQIDRILVHVKNKEGQVMGKINLLEAFKLRKRVNTALEKMEDILETRSLQFEEYPMGQEVPEENLYRKKGFHMTELLDLYMKGYDALTVLNTQIDENNIAAASVLETIRSKNATLRIIQNLAESLRSIPDTRKEMHPITGVEKIYLSNRYLNLEKLEQIAMQYQQEIINLESSLGSINATTKFELNLDSVEILDKITTIFY